MQKVAIIGAGISGLSVACLLSGTSQVVIFEKESTPGGLVRCRKVNGSLFHTCGGHVFNSKRQDVLDWFWNKFHKEDEFLKAERNSVVFMGDGLEIPYPIENHIYLFDEFTQRRIIKDFVFIGKQDAMYLPQNFEEFLIKKFGNTLYEIYFKPYNEKIWRRDLTQVPLSWLEGKLPMPTAEEMIYNNINHVKEKSFVHSTFWYERLGGSQFLADKLAEGLDIRYNMPVGHILYEDGKWIVSGDKFDKVVFCGNIKEMINAIEGVELSQYKDKIDALEYHGTTSVFCEIDKNPYSWIYLPSSEHDSHRVICTGNFTDANNGDSIPSGRITASVEFTDEMNKDEILDNLQRLPLHPKYIDHQYNQYTYPIQDANTRGLILDLKETLGKYDFFFTGRFADWEYYNMDMAIGAAMDLCKNISLE